ncbi:capsular polysaccharide biosynthesis protein [Pseudohalocynthiibacter sp. F2068]|jgi:capsular polysaccharide export protein|uniref:capsular polysaccharide biosynthesis protein n=1 Tax=Pseudohalocynthiibacter sp. F2068 TaxID=2926418 RepID=UPI001FF6D181|nr:capsular polysaccharide biosynthesis protein [Pseudohalocynthiibacter sp. F2068]MCK0102967.1 capsular polysaccharide biosynthesis protein [Pseudohalocynthiibacter sp. F2068]
MQAKNDTEVAEEISPQRLLVYNGGFLTQGRVRRILELSGYKIRVGRPKNGDMIGVWGKSPTSPRGEKVAAEQETPILRVEDALLRSVHPGRSGSAPIGLHLDKRGVYFDSAHPSDLEHLLTTHALDDTALLNRARAAIARLRDAHLSKYNAFDPSLPVPEPGYVLVIDQTKDDASITYGAANEAMFREMLVFAQAENPASRIVIKTHPDTQAGHREGHFNTADARGRVSLLSNAVSPWKLLEGAVAVYTVTSQLGFEAIFAGHKPRVFGQPFYSGWGLTQDENPVARRERKLSRAQLFAATMILYPTWYDPYHDRLCDLEGAMNALGAEARAWREDNAGYVAVGMRLWKRKSLQAFFGQTRKLRFEDRPNRAAERARAEGRNMLVWAGKETFELVNAANELPVARIEDGFLRSKGLGAELVPPLSLVVDDLGIYYDPERESRLEKMIAARAELESGAESRITDILQRIRRSGISKYNLKSDSSLNLPEGAFILVPGQVEDDASIIKGCDDVKSNLELLEAVREANPDATILYKPHPDVMAGLRKGAIPEIEALRHADQVMSDTDPIALIEACNRVWTMTSLLGFEALLRGKPVTCLGAPFYAGWGLTQDFGPVPARRNVRVSLEALAYAALIDYPRYHDPVTNRPCPIEVILDRLETGELPNHGPLNRTLSKLQGLFSSYAYLWR